MGLRAGSLNHRVTLERLSTFVDPVTGEATPVWSTVADLYASVRPLSAKALLSGGVEGSKSASVIVIRYRSDIRPIEMRIREGERIYRIDAAQPDPDSGSEHLSLLVSEFDHAPLEER